MKRSVYRKTDRLLSMVLARMVRTWKEALCLVQPETILRGSREFFRVFTEAQIAGAFEKAQALTRDDHLDQGDGSKQPTVGGAFVASCSSWISGEVKRTIQRDVRQIRAISSLWADLENVPNGERSRDVIRENGRTFGPSFAHVREQLASK